MNEMKMLTKLADNLRSGQMFRVVKKPGGPFVTIYPDVLKHLSAEFPTRGEAWLSLATHILFGAPDETGQFHIAPEHASPYVAVDDAVQAAEGLSEALDTVLDLAEANLISEHDADELDLEDMRNEQLVHMAEVSSFRLALLKAQKK